jgi:hypothetical protein
MVTMLNFCVGAAGLGSREPGDPRPRDRWTALLLLEGMR